MYIEGLLESIKKLKTENKQLGFDKTLLKTQLETFKKVDYANLSSKLSQVRKMAFARLVKEVILDKKNVNLTYELAEAENSLTSLNEDNQRLINTKNDLENKVNDLAAELNSNQINKEEFAKKLLELNDFLKRPTSLAEKLTIPTSDWNYLHTTLGNIAKISEENLFSIKQKEEQVNKLQTEREQLEKDKSGLQNDLAAHVKLLEDELAKARLTSEEKEIIELIQKLKGERDEKKFYFSSNFNIEITTFEKLKTKKLENLPHLGKMPLAFVLIYEKLINKYSEIDNKQKTIDNLQLEIQQARTKIKKLENKIKELENKDRDTLLLLQTANSQRDGIAAERNLLQAKVEELKKRAGQLELELKLIQGELTNLKKQNKTNQVNVDQAQKNLEARIKELESRQLTSNELTILQTLQELFNLTSTSGLTKTNLARVKNLLIKLRTYSLRGNPNLGNLPVTIYESLDALVHSQEITWEKEAQAEEKIRVLEKEINLQVEEIQNLKGEKNKLLEWLKTYRQNIVLHFPKGWGTFKSQKTYDFLNQHTGNYNYNGYNPYMVIIEDLPELNDFSKEIVNNLNDNSMDLTMFGDNTHFLINTFRSYSLERKTSTILYKKNENRLNLNSHISYRSIFIASNSTELGRYTVFPKSKNPLNHGEELIILGIG